MIAKQRVDFIIDALMFLLLSAIAGTGLLIRYVLLPGREGWVEYGSNRLFIWGMERHEWGTIHLFLGLSLLVLLALHIIFHWGMIVSMYSSLIRSRRARRIALCFFTLVCALLILFPFIIKPEVREGGRGYGRQGRTSIEH